MSELDSLTKAYITAGEVMFEAERKLEARLQKDLEALPERAAYRTAEAALKKEIALSEAN